MEREGGTLVHFDEGKRVWKKVPGSRVFDRLSLPAVLDEVDILVNLPKMKVNMMCQVSLAIKNLLVLISFRDRKKFHRGADIAYALVDIAKEIQLQLNIIDTIFAMEGISAHHRTPRAMNILLGSLLPVAVGRAYLKKN